MCLLSLKTFGVSWVTSVEVGIHVLMFTHIWCMQGLDFELIIDVPYWSVYGFIYDLEMRAQLPLLQMDQHDPGHEFLMRPKYKS
jgi:hypothetical protein